MTHKKQGGKKDTVANDRITNEEIQGFERNAPHPKDKTTEKFTTDNAQIIARKQEGRAKG
jgi:hypothetical protein